MIKYKSAVTNLILCVGVSLFLVGCGRSDDYIYSDVEDALWIPSDRESVESTHKEEQELKVEMESGEVYVPIEQAKTEEPEEAKLIVVHVCGAVNNPGVYQLSEGSRVYEAVELAGGYTEEGDPDFVNQASFLIDGMKVQIPTKEEAKEWNSAQTLEIGVLSTEVEQPSGKININTADEKTLCQITGIGQGRAKTIISYREAHGSFQKIEDIMKVDGIKQATFDKIKEQICVN